MSRAGREPAIRCRSKPPEARVCCRKGGTQKEDRGGNRDTRKEQEAKHTGGKFRIN